MRRDFLIFLCTVVFHFVVVVVCERDSIITIDRLRLRERESLKTENRGEIFD